MRICANRAFRYSFLRRKVARGERIESARSRAAKNVYAAALLEFVGKVLPREQILGERPPPGRPVVCGYRLDLSFRQQRKDS